MRALLQRGCLLGALIASLPLAAEEAATPAPAFDWQAPMTVRALPFGNALYEHYRRDQFAALTALMVAENRQQLGEHEQAGKALLGSLQLQYGMLNESEQVLTGALKDVLPESVREQVLVNLAKVRYRANDLDGSLRRLDALPPLADSALSDEVALMRANILLARGDGAGAATALANVNSDGAGARYALFNLGVAQLQQKQHDLAQQSFATLLAKPARDPIARSLRDRTYLALGYDQLRQQNAAGAREQLLRVRLAGPYANSALLGLGWAYAQNGLYAQALTPWLELVSRQPADLPVQEARLAVPFAYQSLNALPDALAGYQSALRAYEDELSHVDAALAAIGNGELARLLPALSADEALSQLQSQGRGQALYLSRLLSSHDFSESLRRYRDLLRLREVLANWQRALPIYDEMLRNHQQRYSERAPKVEQMLGQLDMTAYDARLTSLRAAVENAQQLDNWSLLATEKERARLQRLQRVETSLQRLQAKRGPMPKEQERVRLVAGVQLFDIIHDSAPRQWQQRRALRDTEGAVAELAQGRARLVAARDVAANRFASFGERIARQQGGADGLLKRAETLMQNESLRLQRQAESELKRWRNQLAEYRLQAQLALARLQDKASLAPGGAS